MKSGSIFKKTIFISFLGHFAVFTIFSFSFGPKIPKADFANVSFLGAVLRSFDLTISLHKNASIKKSDTLALDNISQEFLPVFKEYIKPPAALNIEKKSFAHNSIQRLPLLRKQETAIMFYPKLPYHFALYFKDRQAVHIELDFKIILKGERNSIAIKRKISSGNLEADLLSMRYISRYLFIEEGGVITNKWQTVKIDLSAREY